MILSSRIWEELGPLSAVVELVDHDTGVIRFKGDPTTEVRASVQAIVAAHDPALPDSATLERQKYKIDAAAAKAYDKLTALKTMTPAQIQTWVAANVTNLAQAQDAIATLAIAVGILARRL